MFRRFQMFRNPHWQSCGVAARWQLGTKSEPCERTFNWCAAPPWHRLLRFADALVFCGRSLVLRKEQRILVFIVLKPHWHRIRFAEARAGIHGAIGQ